LSLRKKKRVLCVWAGCQLVVFVDRDVHCKETERFGPIVIEGRRLEGFLDEPCNARALCSVRDGQTRPLSRRRGTLRP
jgi:hypothetical protein